MLARAAWLQQDWEPGGEKNEDPELAAWVKLLSAAFMWIFRTDATWLTGLN